MPGNSLVGLPRMANFNFLSELVKFLVKLLVKFVKTGSRISTSALR